MMARAKRSKEDEGVYGRNEWRAEEKISGRK